MILCCQAYLRRKLDFLKSNYGSEKRHYSNYHDKLLQFHATASIILELLEKI